MSATSENSKRKILTINKSSGYHIDMIVFTRDILQKLKSRSFDLSQQCSAPQPMDLIQPMILAGSCEE